MKSLLLSLFLSSIPHHNHCLPSERDLLDDVRNALYMQKRRIERMKLYKASKKDLDTAEESYRLGEELETDLVFYILSDCQVRRKKHQ